MTPRVVDSCLYAGERELLQLRFETLWQHVDAFVVICGSVDFMGAPLPTELLPTDYKCRPVLQLWCDGDYADRRRAAQLGARSSDLLIHGDVDEIPHPGAVDRVAHSLHLQQGMPIRLRPRLHQWCLDWRLDGSDAAWHPFAGPIIAPAEIDPAVLRENVTIDELPDAGWHFQHCIRPTSAIVDKLKRFGHGYDELRRHAEIVEPACGWLDPAWIDSCIEYGRDLLGRWSLVPAELHELPVPVQRDPQRWKGMLRHAR